MKKGILRFGMIALLALSSTALLNSCGSGAEEEAAATTETKCEAGKDAEAKCEGDKAEAKCEGDKASKCEAGKCESGKCEGDKAAEKKCEGDKAEAKCEAGKKEATK